MGNTKKNSKITFPQFLTYYPERISLLTIVYLIPTNLNKLHISGVPKFMLGWSSSVTVRGY